jgi:hypothetical protein
MSKWLYNDRDELQGAKYRARDARLCVRGATTRSARR